MKYIKISKEEIIKAFNNTYNDFVVFGDGDIHKRLVENGIKYVDPKNDINIKLDGDVYWVTTEFDIFEWNDIGDFEIKITFKVRKGSKYIEPLFEICT